MNQIFHVKKSVFCSVLLLITIAITIFIPSARADETAQSLPTITVTAQKQSQSVMDVPTSLTLFTPEDIEERNINGVEDLGFFIPNLMIFNYGVSGNNTPTLRGLSASLESYKVSTGLFVDGMPVLTSMGYEYLMNDIERIEVLRGPQGTLYGKGTEAGAINIITRSPDNDFHARASIQSGFLLSGEADTPWRRKGEFSVSGPLAHDKLFLGVSGGYNARDGFVLNTETDQDVDCREQWNGRAHMRWTPMENLNISLVGENLSYDDGDGSINMGPAGAAMFGLSEPEYRKVTSNLKGENTSSMQLLSLKGEWEIKNNLTLTSITARTDNKQRHHYDYDYMSQTLIHSRIHSDFQTLSQELRLSRGGDGLKWLGGLYLDDSEQNIRTDNESFMGTELGRSDIESNTLAVFGNMTIPLPWKLEFVAGLRYEQDKQEFENLILGTKLEETRDDWTPKVALNYHISPEMSLYISSARGYRSGGFNPVATDTRYTSYEPEKLWSHEFGVKSELLGGRLIANGALFYMAIEQMQVDEAVSTTENYTTNAAEATGMGAEGEIFFRVTPSITLNGGVGYTRIEFDEFQDSFGDYKGNTAPYVPEYTFNVGAQYRHETGAYARVDFMGYGEMYFDKANQYSRDSFQLVNLKIGYEAERFDVYLYGKNIFDETYDSFGYYSGFYTIYSDPGEVGLQLVFRF